MLNINWFWGVPSSQYEEFWNKVTTAANMNPLISATNTKQITEKKNTNDHFCTAYNISNKIKSHEQWAVQKWIKLQRQNQLSFQ